MGRNFEWDLWKARSNRRTHGISFGAAKTVFDDPLALVMDDPLHSAEEVRYVILGRTRRGSLLTVAFTEREDRIRIISARFATRRECHVYEERSE